MLHSSPPKPLRTTTSGTTSVRDAVGVTRRLQSELMSLIMAKDAKEAGVSAFPDGENLLHWRGSVKGADGTPYEGLTFKLDIAFPPQYPFEAPTLVFTTPMFHPNVDLQGNICLDILKDKWSASLSVSAVLQSLRSLLADPNSSSPLNPQAAALWVEASASGNFARYRAEVVRSHSAT